MVSATTTATIVATIIAATAATTAATIVAAAAIHVSGGATVCPLVLALPKIIRQANPAPFSTTAFKELIILARVVNGDQIPPVLLAVFFSLVEGFFTITLKRLGICRVGTTASNGERGKQEEATCVSHPEANGAVTWHPSREEQRTLFTSR